MVFNQGQIMSQLLEVTCDAERLLMLQISLKGSSTYAADPLARLLFQLTYGSKGEAEPAFASG